MLYSKFPSLQTERLDLVEPMLSETHAYFEMRSRAEMGQYIHRRPPATPDDVENWIARVLESAERGLNVGWSMYIKDDHQFMGSMCLWNFSDDGREAELGYEVNTPFQRQGYAREALQAVVHFAFETLHLQKLSAFTHRNNEASIRLLTALQFARNAEAEASLKSTEEEDMWVFERKA